MIAEAPKEPDQPRTEETTPDDVPENERTGDEPATSGAGKSEKRLGDLNAAARRSRA